MSEQDSTSAGTKPRRSRQTNKQNNTQTDYKDKWKTAGQPWRTEPEIDSARQAFLAKRRSITPNIEKGVYPFKDIELSRADVEWLLATHENGRGPVVLQDELQQDRQGLDLRGAILQEQDLRGLPLARLRAGIAYQEDDRSRIVREQIRAARINLMGTKLDNADLLEAELCGAFLYGATLERTNLCQAHLERADLRNASLKETQLFQASLQDADLRNSYLEDVHLEYAHLERTQFNKATIKGGFMIVTQLQKADLREVQIYRVDLKYAHMEKADLRQAQLEKTVCHGAHFEEARLEEADLRDCHLVEAHLEEADLRQAHLEKANLSRAHLKGANLVQAYMEEANLTEAHLETATLIETKLQRAILVKARLEGARLGNAILQEALLNEAHLEGADLEYAHLEGADLLGAHLEGARCCRTFFDSGTRLNGVTLSDEKYGAASLADLSWGNVNLSVVKWSQVKMTGDEQVAREKKHARLVKDKGTVLEEYEVAVRTNRQIAVALQGQGLNEEAARFAYRAQRLQRIVLRRQHKFGQYFFSGFLDLIAGYGYRPGRSVLWYLGIIAFFAVAYHLFGGLSLYPPDAFVYSLTSFHGRGFFPGISTKPSLHDPLILLAAVEAVIGLLIEISFIATFTQRFFGK